MANETQDIVERLRGYHRDSAHGALHEAADEIERLRNELAIVKDMLLNPDPDSEPDVIRLHREKCDALDALRNVRATTIEECAPIADRMAEWYFDHGEQLAHNALELCGERIRALKEQKEETSAR